MPRKRPADETPSAPTRRKWVAPKSVRRMRGKALSAVDKEIILQSFAISGSRKKVAEVTGLSYESVCRIISAARQENTLAPARAAASEALAGKIHERALTAIDNLTPEDFKTERVITRDAEGNITKVQEFGPSLMQKVTALAILVDKEAAITSHIAALRATTASGGGIPLPGDVQSAIDAIRGKVARLRFLDVQFDQQAPDLAQRITAATAARDLAGAAEAEVVEVTDVPAGEFPFDG